MRPIPTKLGAGAAVLALGGLAAVAIARPGHHQAPARPAPVEVRTQVVHQTVRIVRHDKPVHRPPGTSVAAGAPPSPASGTATVASAAPSSYGASAVRTRSSGGGAPAVVPHRTAAPVRTRTSGHSRTVTHRTPVKTRTSGGHGGEHDHEHEHGDD